MLHTLFMETLYCKPTDAAVSMLLSKTFSGFKGTKVAVHICDKGGMSLTSYWSGGTRDYHKIVKLDDMTVVAVPENGSGFTAVDRACGPAGLPVELPAPGYAVVSSTEGSYRAMAIYIHRNNAAKLIPAPIELSWAEKVVLAATRSLKSSYAGVKDYRFVEARRDTSITRQEWDGAKDSLIARKMLNAAGALTVDGRNAIGSKDLYGLKRVDPASQLHADRQVGETEVRAEV